MHKTQSTIPSHAAKEKPKRAGGEWVLHRMEILILAFLTALGKIWVITRFMPARALARHAKWFDLFFVFVVPILFMGTFSGAILAALSGLWFTAMTWVMGLFVKKS